MDALHEAGIAHANITPSSIMVTETGGKISDLGLARVLAADEPITSFAQPAAVQAVIAAASSGSSTADQSVTSGRAVPCRVSQARCRRNVTGTRRMGTDPYRPRLNVVRCETPTTTTS